MADARDLKSLGRFSRAGSSPASGSSSIIANRILILPARYFPKAAMMAVLLRLTT